MATQPADEEESINLWNAHVTPQTYGSTPDLYYEHALAQYKQYVESTEQVSTRRAAMNALFVTVQTLLVTAVGFMLDAGFTFQPRWLIIFPLVSVLLLCWFWLRLIRSYRTLSEGKFRVIEEYEKRLPTAPYVQAEWRGALRMNTQSGRYRRFTEVEQAIPLAFAFLYLVGALAVIFLL